MVWGGGHEEKFCNKQLNPHGFMAATSMKLDGKVSEPAAREMVT